MDKLYHIYQEEVHPELLPPIILQTLGEKRERQYSDYRDNVLQPAIQDWTIERDQLLEKYARMAGFENYDQAQNIRWDGTLKYEADNIVKLRKLDTLMASDEYDRCYIKKDGIMQADSDYYISLCQNDLYEILKLTRPMMDRTDFKGQPVLEPDEWMKAYQTEYDQRMNEGHAQYRGNAEWLPEYIRSLHTYRSGKYDEGILPLVEPLQKAGFQVTESHSGMVGDHPYERYLTDDTQGRYKAGQHKYWGTQAPATCLQLMAAQMDKDILLRLAAGTGFRMETNTYGDRTSVTLTLPATRDGSTQKEVVNDFLNRLRQTGAMRPNGYIEQIELINQNPDLYSQVVEEHGGWTIFSDEMIKSRLNNLTYQLVNNAQQILNPPIEIQQAADDEEKVDMGRLFAKYISLVEQVHGKEKAEEIVHEILGKTAELEHQLISGNTIQNEQYPDKVVLLDTQTSRVDVYDYASARYNGELNNPRYINVSDRITEVNVYRASNANEKYRLRCKVDGEQQMSIPLSDNQNEYWRAMLNLEKQNRDHAKLRLVGELYADKLIQADLGQNETQGRKL